MASTAYDAFIHKIFAKVTQLQSRGLYTEDRNTIKGNRLNLIWLEPTGDSVPKQTRWRQNRARDKYREIQEASSHLFLAVFLTIPPSICFSSEFQFSLSLKEKELFESAAAEQGYAGSTLYLRFMQVMFPEVERRQIQYAYGLVARDDLGSLFHAIEQGTYNSKQWDQEKAQGGSKTGCLTILIPTNQDQDGSCTIRVERKTLIQSIKKFKLTKLKLE
ncbi:hypothetical protein Pdw03_8611 [Penicillium digitatum]|uniref:Uncharacterized protein n=1 Tax=Penicillium digitatum TaxID=36651 RepID=A0A7T6XP88_PENDI|nr:hypothetical protein Pdw03_8611 [Penicillium digitatum]